MHAFAAMYWRPPPRWSRWPDLPPDLIREVSGRLHHAADFVRFHAVCKPWRDSRDAPPPLSRRTNNQFLPWLLAPPDQHLSFRCVFSKTSYRAPHRFGLRKWVASADGAAAPYLTALPDGRPRLEPDLTPLPHLPYEIDRWKENSCGVVYSDGTTFLYNFSDLRSYGHATWFTAALLRPGDAAWTVVQRRLEFPEPGECCAAYHGGKIMVTVDANLWYVVTPGAANGAAADDDVLIPMTSMPGDHDEYLYKYSYVLESRGELLWVSVQVRTGYPEQCGEGVRGLVRALSVSVHSLEPAEAPEKMRWARKDGRSLGDRVLFLGWPNSFAVDASRLGSDGVTGGCAYFVYKDEEWRMAQERCCVFRYNLVDGKVKFVEWLPPGWDDEACMWLVPQPAMAPNQEISHRLDPKWWNRPEVPTPRSVIYTERPHQQHYYEPCFRVFVRNLPLSVDSSRLHRFFSNHGKVDDAEVICSRKTGVSQGIGLVTMATVDGRADALAALDGLVLDGCSLEVSLVKKRRRRRRRMSSS